MTPMYIRVFQHDTADEIRVGKKIWVQDIDAAVSKCRKAYEEKCAWCGGLEAACEKYYQRIALVDADTLKELRTIYPVKEDENHQN